MYVQAYYHNIPAVAGGLNAADAKSLITPIAENREFASPDRQIRDQIEVYDFFCGCGGTSAGLREAGLRIVLGLDFNADAGRTYRRNFPEADFLDRDIRSVLTADIERLIPKTRTNPILFSACAPCQPFSRQNRLKKRTTTG